MFRTVIALPGTVTVKDMSIIELITQNPYFDGEERMGFATGCAHDELLSVLTDIFWEGFSGVNIDRIRRNWTRLNEMVDEAFASGHYPENPAWD
ncbi:hypothetical protein D3C79_836700 [compost metagenome]